MAKSRDKMKDGNARNTIKTSVQRRSLNAAGTAGKKPRGAPMSDQDLKRRLGNYEGAGEAPLRGSRMTGIGGQSKQKYATDKKKKSE